MKTKFLYILTLISLLTSCVTQKPQYDTKTWASKYNPAGYVLHPQFKVFHEANNYSKLYFKIFTKELRFSSANKERNNQAIIKVSYKITPSIRSKDILDSAQTILTINKIKKQTSIISFIKIEDIKAEQYMIEVNLVDLYGNKKSQSFIRVNKSNDENQQYFLSLKAKNKKPEFSEHFRSSDTLLIKSKNTDIKEMSVIHYTTDFKIADKPYITIKDSSIYMKKYSSWKIPVKSWKATFHSNKPGVYIIRSDTSKIRGLMKVQFKNAYPLITKSSEMIEALQYILSNEEYNKMDSSENKKLSIDRFWIKASGDKERAKELIKIWYNRTTFSNYYFTSYKEGRKTDRGMIYTLFGPPDDLQYFDDAEKWIYINSKKDNKLDFVFVKQSNSISNNDFMLIRKSKYEPYWKKAVKSWRSGRVYKY